MDSGCARPISPRSQSAFALIISHFGSDTYYARNDELKVDEARKSLTQRVRELSEIKEEIQSAQFLEMQALDMGGAAGIGHSDSNAKPTK